MALPVVPGGESGGYEILHRLRSRAAGAGGNRRFRRVAVPGLRRANSLPGGHSAPLAAARGEAAVAEAFALLAAAGSVVGIVVAFRRAQRERKLAARQLVIAILLVVVVSGIYLAVTSPNIATVPARCTNHTPGRRLIAKGPPARLGVEEPPRLEGGPSD